jgi:hypothetical protein
MPVANSDPRVQHWCSRRENGTAKLTAAAVAPAWKQKGAYAAAFEEAMVSAHNAR